MLSMRFACWITTATQGCARVRSEYVLLTAFSRQQWLRERVSVWRYTYTARLVRIQEVTPLQPGGTYKYMYPLLYTKKLFLCFV
jgi:hypothetical protein